jgi:hypothetical protein
MFNLIPWPGQHGAGIELGGCAPDLHPGGFPERILAAGAGELAYRSLVERPSSASPFAARQYDASKNDKMINHLADSRSSK